MPAVDDFVEHRRRRRRGHGDDGDGDPFLAHHAPEGADVVDGHAAARPLADLLALAVEQRGNLEPFGAEAGVVGQRQPEVAGAHDRDPDAAVEAEDLPQVRAQLLDVVADAADAELAEIGEILANLRGVQVELLGQRLRRDRLHAGLVERVEAAQVDRQAVGGQLRDRLEVRP